MTIYMPLMPKDHYWSKNYRTFFFFFYIFTTFNDWGKKEPQNTTNESRTRCAHTQTHTNKKQKKKVITFEKNTNGKWCFKSVKDVGEVIRNEKQSTRRQLQTSWNCNHRERSCWESDNEHFSLQVVKGDKSWFKNSILNIITQRPHHQLQLHNPCDLPTYTCLMFAVKIMSTAQHSTARLIC